MGDFDGPLDLLLHLVRVNEVEISNIPIVEITRQYNEHLDLMRDLNLDIAGDYLIMAATLMYIKSRFLLPPDPDLLEEEAGEDPRAELAQQLLEYQRFKQAAETLQALESRQGLVWTRTGIPEEFEGEELLAVDMFDLLRAFRKLLGRLGDDARQQLSRETVSVADKILWLTELLDQRGSLELLPLLADLPSVLERIATFLALLEMLRMERLVVFQRVHFDEIRIALVQESAEDTMPGEGETE